jgi:hypothetical protein
MLKLCLTFGAQKLAKNLENYTTAGFCAWKLGTENATCLYLFMQMLAQVLLVRLFVHKCWHAKCYMYIGSQGNCINKYLMEVKGQEGRIFKGYPYPRDLASNLLLASHSATPIFHIAPNQISNPKY